MKNKKYLSYILFLLFAFLLIGNVYAANISYDVSIPAGSSAQIVNGSVYVGAECGEVTKIGDTGTLSQGTLSKADSSIRVYANAKATGTDKVTCSYKRRSPDYYNDDIGPGTLNITIHYVDKIEGNLPEYHFTLDKQHNKSHDLAALYNIGNVKSAEIKDNTYVDLNCGGSTCAAIVKEGAPPVEGGIVETTGVIKFTTKSGLNATLPIAITVTSKMTVFAYGGDFGSCQWNSVSTEWQPMKPYNLTANNSKTNSKQYDYTDINETIYFPKCSADGLAGEQYDFYGWVTEPNDTEDAKTIGDSAFMTDECTKYETGVKPSATVYRYSACYKSTDIIFLHLNSEDEYFKDGALGNFTQSTLSGDYYLKTKKAVLPTPSYKTENIENVKFLGWSKDKCKTLVNGEATPGYYTACFQHTSGSADSSERTIYVGKKETATFDDFEMDSCSSSLSKYLTATIISGNNGGKSCLLTGIKETPKGEWVKVTFTDKNDKEKVYKFTVVGDGDFGEIDVDSFILDSSSGSQLDDSLFGSTGNVEEANCDKFEIRTDKNWKATNGVKIGQMSKDRGLYVHMYYGESKCKGKNYNYVGICMDPGRQEPARYAATEGNSFETNYYRERDLNPDKNNFFDNLIAYIYTDTEFLQEMKNISKDTSNHVVAATVAIRLAAIKYGEAANNTGLGLDEYYVAYKEMVKNLNEVSSDWSNLKNLLNSSDGTNRKKAFCGPIKGCDIEDKYAKIVLEYLSMSKNYEKETSKITVSVTNQETVWTPDKKGYTKIITGVISGFKGKKYTKKLTFTKNICSGRYKNLCKLEFKNPSGEWELVNSASNGKTNYINYADLSGNLYFRITIGEIKLSYLNKDDDFGVTLNSTYGSTDIGDAVALTTPSNSVNQQRMILFPISASLIDGGGSGSGSGSGTGLGSGDGDIDPEDLEVAGVYEDAETGNKIPLVFVNKYFDVGTTLPACDTSIDMFDYKNNCKNKTNCGAPFSKEIFVSAGCCSLVLDETTYVYKNVCNTSCTESTVSPVCNVNTSGLVDSLDINEGSIDAGGYGGCIIDLIHDIDVPNYEKKTDIAGNLYSIELFDNNRYCRVSCKEDWNFKFPGLKNYVGANAIRAGSYFPIRNDNIYIKGKRTCITTKINHSQYEKDAKDAAVASQNNFDLWQKKSAIHEVYQAAKRTETESYYCKDAVVDVAAHCSANTETVTYSQTDCPAGQWIGTTYKCNDVGKCTDYTLTPSQSSVSYKKSTEKGTADTSSDTPEISSNNVSNGSCTCDSEGNCTCSGTTNGSCSNKKYNSIFSSKFGFDLSEDGSSELSAMNNANANLSSYTRDINACDNFELVTADSKNVDADAVQIMTTFAPSITFEYDEKEYMKEIGGNNKLVKNDALNKKCTSDEACANGAVVSSVRKSSFYTKLTDSAAYDGDSVDGNSRVKFQEVICSSGGSGTAVVGASKESFGHVTEWSADPSCYPVDLSYLSANYIKKSIEDSSYYYTTFKWWVNSITDVKIYAESLSSYKGSGVVDQAPWGRYGNADDNVMVFPIMVRTPRNIYKYSFTLTNIGMYNDRVGTVGRLMGGDKSVMSNNVRTCFYEVIENICLCCADVIDTETSGKKVDGKVSTEDALKASGYNYKMSGFKKEFIGKEGQLGFFTSSVSLADLNSDSNRTLGANWTNGTHYLVNGTVETTSKGAVLKKFIEAKGEDVYSTTPEYSYTLTPTAMSAIRSYNDSHSYQATEADLRLVGNPVKTYVNCGSNKNICLTKNWDTTSKKDSVNYVTLSHYASIFLQDKLAPYVTEEYKGKTFVDRNGVCFITEVDPKSNINSFSGVTIYGTKGTTQSISSCRWIDYVEQSAKDKNVYTRLAFK